MLLGNSGLPLRPMDNVQSLFTFEARLTPKLLEDFYIFLIFGEVVLWYLFLDYDCWPSSFVDFKAKTELRNHFARVGNVFFPVGVLRDWWEFLNFQKCRIHLQKGMLLRIMICQDISAVSKPLTTNLTKLVKGRAASRFLYLQDSMLYSFLLCNSRVFLKPTFFLFIFLFVHSTLTGIIKF